ncbi:hypothetical protein [uncultured Jannaschia sp.]|uniref:hypothetical protein n=1 Tax=uncultured Jannaschia sp. TaxID=293347 RepID=UPI002620EE13|nr:hypothetical protein [uncultured Jannaschia sp.]
MKLTLSQAARDVKKSKGTLSKALHSGALSGTKTDDGSWQIDHSELMRWVSAARPRERPEDRSERLSNPPETPDNAPGWKARIALMQERLNDATGTIADLRNRLDASEAERRALNQQLLAAPRFDRMPSQEPPGAPEKPQERQRGVLGWLRRARH